MYPLLTSLVGMHITHHIHIFTHLYLSLRSLLFYYLLGWLVFPQEFGSQCHSVFDRIGDNNGFTVSVCSFPVIDIF